MRFFELLESGLPPEQFVVMPPAARRDGDPAPRRPRVRFRPNSPWTKNRAAGQRLTWRGRSFVEAFAEVNKREILEASFLDLSEGKELVALGGWRPGQPQLERYHFVCRTSEGASMAIAGERAQPRPGELWRINDKFHPAVLRGGVSGSLHLTLVLAPLHGRELVADLPSPEDYINAPGINGGRGRSLMVG